MNYQEKSVIYRDVQTNEYGKVQFTIWWQYKYTSDSGRDIFNIGGHIENHEGHSIKVGDITHEIAQYIPELAHLLKWDGWGKRYEKVYLSNVMAKVSNIAELNVDSLRNLEKARKCAVWPEANLEQLRDVNQLLARFPLLLDQFKCDMVKLGINLY